MNEEKYVGHPIYIHGKDGNDLASTVILEYLPEYMTVTVKGVVRNDSEIITVLILETDGVHEYQGRIRRGGGSPGNTEIALFGGKVKETRSAKRYTVNITAKVESLVLGGKAAPLLHPIDVMVVNLSTSGTLLQAKPNSFHVGSVIGLKLPIDDSSESLHAKIVWIKEIDSATGEYGCEFI